MQKIKRDTTKDLFHAVLNLVRKNGHYDKAEAIMDYVLPHEFDQFSSKEYIELSNYEFDFEASPQFGGSEGIYVSCYLHGKYTENELKEYNHSTGTLETETRRNIGTFKTLKTDIHSMKIMGELCGALVYYASQYVNSNLDRYTPARELESQRRTKNCSAAKYRYIYKLANDMAVADSVVSCDICAGNKCADKQNGCIKGIREFLRREIGRYCHYRRYDNDEAKNGKYYNFLDGSYNAGKDCFDDYVDMLTANFSDLTVYEAAGRVYTWIQTRKQKFIYYFKNDGKKINESGTNKVSYDKLPEYEQKQAFKIVKTQIFKETIENGGDITDITDDKVNYYVKNCLYFYEKGNLSFEY